MASLGSRLVALVVVYSINKVLLFILNFLLVRAPRGYLSDTPGVTTPVAHVPGTRLPLKFPPPSSASSFYPANIFGPYPKMREKCTVNVSITYHTPVRRPSRSTPIAAAFAEIRRRAETSERNFSPLGEKKYLSFRPRRPVFTKTDHPFAAKSGGAAA